MGNDKQFAPTLNRKRFVDGTKHVAEMYPIEMRRLLEVADRVADVLGEFPLAGPCENPDCPYMQSHGLLTLAQTLDGALVFTEVSMANARVPACEAFAYGLLSALVAVFTWTELTEKQAVSHLHMKAERCQLLNSVLVEPLKELEE